AGLRAAQRQTQIVDYGGLRLLLPLSQSRDSEVRRLAAHALANLSANGACSWLLERFPALTRVSPRRARSGEPAADGAGRSDHDAGGLAGHAARAHAAAGREGAREFGSRRGEQD